MTAAHQGCSDRCCPRVESTLNAPTENRARRPDSAPESLTDQVRRPAPERGAAQAKRSTSLNFAGGSQRDRAERLLARISPRDLALLTSLDAHRFLTTNQLQRFHFSEHATNGAASRVCRRVLSRLLELQLIEHLERRVGGVRAGSASYVWRVGVIGDRLLRLRDSDRPRARRREPALRFLRHCLAIADAHLVLLDLTRSGRAELLAVATEPDCWRSYQGIDGSPEHLKPDLAAVTASGEFEDHWFIEIDRATESLPTLIRKCVQYEDYRRTGREQQDGGVFPLVVWIVPTDEHAGKLRAAIAASSRLDPDLYRICLHSTFAGVITGSDA